MGGTKTLSSFYACVFITLFDLKNLKILGLYQIAFNGFAVFHWTHL